MSVKFTNIIFISLLLSSCDLINRDEKIPTYIQVDDFELTRDGVEISSNIVDVWFGTASTDLGVYEFPTTIPLLEDGEVIITAEAGIYLNGISYDKNKYFFYKPFRDTLTLTGGETIKVTPKISYIDEAVFSIDGSEDFEESGSSNFKSAEGNNIIYEADNEFGDNNEVGIIYASNGNGSQLEMNSKKDFLIDNEKQLAPVYLEFDYKTNSEMEVGLYITFDNLTETFPFVTFYPTDGEWVHAYVSLVNEVNVSSVETLYRIYFRGEESPSDSDYIALDNVKIVYAE